MAFQTGHGRKNFVVIKTAKGYYNAYVAGLDTWTQEPHKAVLFVTADQANKYYAKAVHRNLSKALPTQFEVVKVKLKNGADNNR